MNELPIDPVNPTQQNPIQSDTLSQNDGVPGAVQAVQEEDKKKVEQKKVDDQANLAREILGNEALIKAISDTDPYTRLGVKKENEEGDKTPKGDVRKAYLKLTQLLHVDRFNLLNPNNEQSMATTEQKALFSQIENLIQRITVAYREIENEFEKIETGEREKSEKEENERKQRLERLKQAMDVIRAQPSREGFLKVLDALVFLRNLQGNELIGFEGYIHDRDLIRALLDEIRLSYLSFAPEIVARKIAQFQVPEIQDIARNTIPILLEDNKKDNEKAEQSLGTELQSMSSSNIDAIISLLNGFQNGQTRKQGLDFMYVYHAKEEAGKIKNTLIELQTTLTHASHDELQSEYNEAWISQQIQTRISEESIRTALESSTKLYRKEQLKKKAYEEATKQLQTIDDLQEAIDLLDKFQKDNDELYIARERLTQVRNQMNSAQQRLDEGVSYRTAPGVYLASLESKFTNIVKTSRDAYMNETLAGLLQRWDAKRVETSRALLLEKERELCEMVVEKIRAYVQEYVQTFLASPEAENIPNKEDIQKSIIEDVVAVVQKEVAEIPFGEKTRADIFWSHNAMKKATRYPGEIWSKFDRHVQAIGYTATDAVKSRCAELLRK